MRLTDQLAKQDRETAEFRELLQQEAFTAIRLYVRGSNELRDAIRSYCAVAIKNSPEIELLGERLGNLEAQLSELLDAVNEQNAALAEFQTKLSAETAEINAKLDELASGAADIPAAVEAIRANTARINEAAAAVSAIIPDEAPPPVDGG